MKITSSLLFFFISISSFSCNSQINRADENNIETKQAVKKDTNSWLLNIKLIDTNLIFRNLEEAVAYSNSSSIKINEFCKSIQEKVADGHYIADSVRMYNQELILIFLYKNLLLFNKTKKEVTFLFPIFKNSTLIDDNKKKSLLAMYPKEIQNSATGQQLRNILNEYPQNEGVNFRSFLKTKIKDKYNNSIPFESLFTSDSKKYLVVIGASWCSPCRHQDISIERAITRGDIDTGLIRIIHISIDKSFTKWNESLNEFVNKKYRYICDEGLASKMFYELKITGVPHYILLSNNLNIIREESGLIKIMPFLKRKRRTA